MAAPTDYTKELIETANRIARPGHGILAADESTATIGKKFVAINVENNEENRRRYRELLFTTPDLEKYISGIILYEETAKQSTKDGKPFMTLLQERGIIPGIKVDKGLQFIPRTKEEQFTTGLDDLAKRCAEFYKMGCRFAKWRAVLKIEGDTLPSELSIQENAWTLARYAAICQQNGLVPIVEPEILADGTHTIERSEEVTERVLSVVFKALADQKVLLEGALLKPNMVTPGLSATTKATSQQIAEATVRALSRTVPPALPGITFLSGGQSEEEATLNLNAMNQITSIKRPWSITFSYGRALQNSAVKTWAGKDENLVAAQTALITRARANGEANLGQYKGGAGGAAGTESLKVENYTY